MAVVPLSNILSCLTHQYGSIDTLNTNIHPLVIILWQIILKQQYVALTSILFTLPNRNFYREAHSRNILYCSRIRKNVTDRQTDRKQRKNREFNYRGHSYLRGLPGWAGQQVAGAGFRGPLLICIRIWKNITNKHTENPQSGPINKYIASKERRIRKISHSVLDGFENCSLSMYVTYEW